MTKLIKFFTPVGAEQKETAMSFIYVIFTITIIIFLFPILSYLL